MEDVNSIKHSIRQSVSPILGPRGAGYPVPLSHCKFITCEPTSSIYKIEMEGKGDSLFQSQAPLPIEIRENVPALSVKLEDLPMVLPQTPSVRDRHERDV